MYTTFVIYRKTSIGTSLYPHKTMVKVKTSPVSTCMRRAAEEAIKLEIITEPGSVFVKNAEKQGGGRIFQVEPLPTPNLRVAD